MRSRTAGSELLAVRADGGSALYAVSEAHAALQAIAAPRADVAATLLAAPFERGASALLFLNGPADGPVADALDVAGATRLARQHELAIAL